MSTATDTAAPNTATQPSNGNGHSTAVAKAPATIRDWLKSDSMKNQVAQALPKHLKPERFMRIALTALSRTPKLAECDQVSFFKALLDLSQYGIEPDGRRAHLIPFMNNKRGCMEVQLIIDWKGIAELIMRSGLVSNLHADIVCENDDFEYDRGAIVRHRIDFRKDRGKIYAVYCVCRLKDGTEKCDVMTVADAERIRARSKAGKNGPWVTDFNEMAKKTVFRRLSKWLPWSSEIRDAIETDDEQFEELASSPRKIIETAGATKSDQLADVLGAAGDSDLDVAASEETVGNASGLEQSGEESQTAGPASDGNGNFFSEGGADLVHKINGATGDYDKLCSLLADVVARYKPKSKCEDPEGQEIYRLIDDAIAKAKPKKK